MVTNFFGEAVDKLDISECNNISDTVGYSDLAEIIIKKNTKTILALLLLLKSSI